MEMRLTCRVETYAMLVVGLESIGKELCARGTMLGVGLESIGEELRAIGKD